MMIKRIFDIIISTTIILILLPVLIFCSIILLFQNKTKIFFVQNRIGKDEKIFKIIKFQTMSDKKDENGSLLPDDKRLTPIGKLVRKLSIDELPQLLNVIKGNMSLVGPRPLLIEYLPLYNENQKRRHQVKPGITGWAQVNGRNAITWQEKFNFDVWYVDNMSFCLDLKIICLTIIKILRREGISSNTHATMEKFEGNIH